MALNTNNLDVIIIGGGAAGLMCAIEAGKRGRRVLVIEHAEKIGKKILISGGGRCNFTNTGASPESYQSQNAHFSKSALARYAQTDFVNLVKKHQISFFEKKLGQLFCKGSSREIVSLLSKECHDSNVQIRCNCVVNSVSRADIFTVDTNQGHFSADSLVIASGALSIPKMGATGFGYEIARQFGVPVTRTKAGLVPFVFDPDTLKRFEGLSGISLEAEVSCNGMTFSENILITHRGVSGPAILQISSFWDPGDAVSINLLPTFDLAQSLEGERKEGNKVEVRTFLADLLPKRFVQRIFEVWLTSKPIVQLSNVDIQTLATFFHHWTIKPVSTEGYRTAEVTVGGVDTDHISSKTFECKNVPGLYFIGEVLDVTGWLGGYNFQWAWSSGWCAGQYA